MWMSNFQKNGHSSWPFCCFSSLKLWSSSSPMSSKMTKQAPEGGKNKPKQHNKKTKPKLENKPTNFPGIGSILATNKALNHKQTEYLTWVKTRKEVLTLHPSCLSPYMSIFQNLSVWSDILEEGYKLLSDEPSIHLNMAFNFHRVSSIWRSVLISHLVTSG